MLGSGEEEGKREEDEKEKEKEEEENWDQNKGLSRKEETKRENKEREKGKEGDQIERKDTSTSKQEKKETKKVKRLRWIIDYYASGIKDDFFSSKKEKVKLFQVLFDCFSFDPYFKDLSLSFFLLFTPKN